MQRRLDQIDESIARYLAQIASADIHDTKTSKAKTKRLRDKIAGLEEELERLKKLRVRMLEAPDEQISLTVEVSLPRENVGLITERHCRTTITAQGS